MRIGDDDEVRLCKVSVTADGVPYVFLATNMDSSGYRLHTVSVCVDTQRLTAAEIADAVYSRTRPTEEETAAVRQKAEDMLAAMDIGQWTVTSCEASGGEDDSGPYFLQTVTACPVYEGLALTPVGETGTGSGYTDDYDDAAIRFTFSGGRLVSFDYTGPLDIVQTVNENVQTLSFDELTSRFRQQMELSDTSAFQADVPEELAASLPQIASAAVTVNGIAFGLARVRVRDSVTDFYLLPAYIFTGSYLLTYADGTAEESPAGTVLAVLNAVDGSVIDPSQGY